MPGGFIGAGAKTVIPAKAVAKVSMRLVPEMEPQNIFNLYKRYVESICPNGISLDVRLIHSGRCNCRRRGQSIRRSGYRCVASSLWERHGLYPLRRLHPHCR